MYCPNCYRFISDTGRPDNCPSCRASLSVLIKDKSARDVPEKRYAADFETAVKKIRDDVSRRDPAPHAVVQKIKEPGVITLAFLMNALGGFATLVRIIPLALNFFASMNTIDLIHSFIFLVTVLILIALGTWQIKTMYGLRRHEIWARKSQIIISSLGLLVIPIGTLLHGYILYRLTQDEKVKSFFNSSADRSPNLIQLDADNIGGNVRTENSNSEKRSRTKGAQWKRNTAAILAILIFTGGAGLWWQSTRHKQDTFKADPQALVPHAIDAQVAVQTMVDDDLRARKDLAEKILACMHEQDLSVCLDIAQKAVKLYSQEPAFQLLEMLILHDLNRKDEAFKILEQIEKMKGFDYLLEKGGAEVCIAMAIMHTSAGHVDAAKQYEEKALSLNSTEKGVKLGFAKLKAFQKNLGGMIHDYEVAIKSGDEPLFTWQDYFILATGYLNTFNPTDFGRIFAKARARFPRSPGFHLLLSLEHVRSQRIVSAYYETLFEREVDLTGEDYFKEALDQIDQAFMKVVDDPQVRPEPGMENLYHFLQGMKLYKSGEMSGAVEKMMMSIQNGDVHPIQYIYTARALVAIGRKEEALALFKKAERTFDFARVSAEESQILLELNRFDEALAAWKKAESIDSGVNNFFKLAVRFNAVKSAEPPVKVTAVEKPVSTAEKITAQKTTENNLALLKRSDVRYKAEMNQFIVAQFKSLMGSRFSVAT